MAKIDKDLIQKLRMRTGCGMMDCKKALEETDGDLEKALELLRKKGASFAAKRSEHATAEGVIEAYIHPGNQLGVMVEVDCETDFVARTDELKKFAKDLCMHIAAMKPLYLTPEDVDEKFLETERKIVREQLADSGKPEKIIEQIVEGKIKKIFSEVCLLQQPYVKNDQLTIEDLLKEIIAKTGENIIIKRFCLFEIGA
jgi:elongation factor Ts